MKRIILFFIGLVMSASLTAQQTDSETWQPDYNEDQAALDARSLAALGALWFRMDPWKRRR